MRRMFLAALALALAATACGSDESRTVRLLAHDFFAVPDEVVAEFEDTTGITLEIILGGDAGLMVNQAVLTAGNPIADVIFGVDTTLLSRTLAGDLFEPSTDPTPIDFGDVCLNYDRDTLPDPPERLEDLTGPAFTGQLVVPDPRASSPGLAFLLATIERFGGDGDYSWRDYWADLVANDVEVAADWGTAYYGSFSGAGTGDRPLVVSYASSPPAEVVFSDPPIERATTGVITDGCFRQVEYAGMLRGAPNKDEANALIEFMLGESFQASVATSMLVFPIDPSIELPRVFTDNTTIPASPVEMDPDRIEQNRERWLAEWTDVVLG